MLQEKDETGRASWPDACTVPGSTVTYSRSSCETMDLTVVQDATRNEHPNLSTLYRLRKGLRNVLLIPHDILH